MFINGVLVKDSDDIDAIIEALKNLPPIFSNAEGVTQKRCSYRPIIPTNPEFESLNQRANTLATAVFSEWNTYRNTEALQQFITIRQSAADACNAAGQPLAEAEHLLLLGHVGNSVNRGAELIPILDRAVSIFEQHQWNIKLYTALGELHCAITDAIAAKEQNGDIEEAKLLQDRLRPIRQKSLEAYHQLNNEPVNPQARRVAQREIGFSDKEPLGSNNISECVVLMIGDPTTGKIAEVHFDERTIESSLQTLFEYMPTPTNSNPWQIQIMGGCQKERDELTQISYKNVKAVASFFREYPVNFVKQAILTPDQPTAATFYPKTFEVRQEAPPMEEPNGFLADAKTRLAESGPLAVAIDTSKSNKRAPVLLSTDEVEELELYGKDEKTISETVAERFEPSRADLPGAIEEITRLIEAHQHAVKDLEGRLIAKINLFKTHEQLRRLNVEFDQSDIDEAIARINRHEIYIGEGAKEANQPLMDFIVKTNQLIKITKQFDAANPNGKHVAKFDFDGLDKITFTGQPHETIKVPSHSSPKRGR